MKDPNDAGVDAAELVDLSTEDDLDNERPEESLRGMAEEQQQEAEAFAVQFLRGVIRLRGVRIDRTQFLTAELHKRGVSRGDIDRALTESPALAGAPISMLDDIASASIRFETNKSSAISFAAGLPGGMAMLGTVPGDITQFYVHAFRIMQKLSYVYGWQSLLGDFEKVDDETLGRLTSLLGIMMGVGAASGAVTSFAASVAAPAVQKQIAKAALTKTSWYSPMKQVLRFIGIRVTKQTFANTVSKAVPVVGGVVSGGMTMVTLSTQSKRLMRHLRELPPPHVDAAEYLAALRLTDSAEKEPRLKAAASQAKQGAAAAKRGVYGAAGRVRDAGAALMSRKPAAKEADDTEGQ